MQIYLCFDFWCNGSASRHYIDFFFLSRNLYQKVMKWWCSCFSAVLLPCLKIISLIIPLVVCGVVFTIITLLFFVFVVCVTGMAWVVSMIFWSWCGQKEDHHFVSFLGIVLSIPEQMQMLARLLSDSVPGLWSQAG